MNEKIQEVLVDIMENGRDLDLAVCEAEIAEYVYQDAAFCPHCGANKILYKQEMHEEHRCAPEWRLIINQQKYGGKVERD